MNGDGARVQGMPWHEFLQWFGRHWAPGEHVALIGPTGVGKSTAAGHLLGLRRWVMAADPKGGDSTLAKLLQRGYVRVSSWPPPPEIRRRIERREPVRLILGPVVTSRQDLPKLRDAIAAGLDAAFDEGGWTVYLDELQVAADKRLMNLGASIERNLIAARDRKVSMVTAFQRPANVPRSAADQASWVLLWYSRDVDVQNRLAEMTGRPKAEIRGALRGLAPFTVLVFGRNPRDPILVTSPPRL